MTNKEALEILDTIPTIGEQVDALEMAIDALEQQPCEDCISRAYIEPIIEELENICVNGDEYILSLLSNIKNAPSITPHPKVGRWLADVDRWGDIVTTVNGYRCSECNTFNTDKDNYCPNCGAKMEVEE